MILTVSVDPPRWCLRSAMLGVVVVVVAWCCPPLLYSELHNAHHRSPYWIILSTKSSVKYICLYTNFTDHLILQSISTQAPHSVQWHLTSEASQWLSSLMETDLHSLQGRTEERETQRMILQTQNELCKVSNFTRLSRCLLHLIGIAAFYLNPRALDLISTSTSAYKVFSGGCTMRVTEF